MADLSEKVYRQLKEDLMEEVFPINELIVEQTLIERYGVSRTPVREAAMRLVHEGYLTKYPKKGYAIRCTGPEELRELQECRYILESGVIDIIAASAKDDEIRSLLSYMNDKSFKREALVLRSQQFHINMARLTGNEQLVELLSSLMYKVARPLARAGQISMNHYLELAADEDYIDPEHLQIVDALLARDAAAAKKVLHDDVAGVSPF